MKSRNIEWFRRDILGNDVTKARAYQIVREYGVPHFRIGSRLYFDEDRVAAWVRAQERGSVEPVEA